MTFEKRQKKMPAMITNTENQSETVIMGWKRRPISDGDARKRREIELERNSRGIRSYPIKLSRSEKSD